MIQHLTKRWILGRIFIIGKWGILSKKFKQQNFNKFCGYKSWTHVLLISSITILPLIQIFFLCLQFCFKQLKQIFFKALYFGGHIPLFRLHGSRTTLALKDAIMLRLVTRFCNLRLCLVGKIWMEKKKKKK